MRLAWRSFVSVLILVVVPSPGLYGQAKPDTTKLISALSGTWKEDQSKRQFGSAANLHFRTAAAGGLEELRGPELRPMIQPVKFDGKLYLMEGGNSLAWKQISASEFERTTERNGKQLSARRLRISADGKTITEETERMALDGFSSKRSAEYRRTGPPGTGLVGKWQLVKASDTVPAELKYEAAGSNSVKVSSRLGQNYTLSFDGKEALVTGPNIIPGMKLSVSSHTAMGMETITTREGIKTSTSRLDLSQGGKVMTVTNNDLGSKGKPGVLVFRKQ